MGAERPIAVDAARVPARARASNYPEPFAQRMAGRLKHPLGNVFGLKNFGVNLTRLAPGAVTALRHAHSRQDEFVFVLEGEPTLVTDAGGTPLRPGMRSSFAAGADDAHQFVNRTGREGGWRFTRKDGTPLRGSSQPCQNAGT